MTLGPTTTRSTEGATLVHRTLAVLICATVVASCGSDTSTTDDTRTAHTAAVQVLAIGCPAGPYVGGGSYVDSDLVLTVAHVVAGSSTVTVTTEDGRTLEAEVVAIDRRKDLAVLRVDAGTASLAFGDLHPGAQGAMALWRDGSITSGMFRTDDAVDIHTNDIDDDGPGRRRGYVIEARITEGDSGTVLVADGRAVGVVFARSAERADRAWAIDIDEATPLVGQARSTAGSVSAGACAHGPDGDADRDDP